jgi:hypothetical protein
MRQREKWKHFGVERSPLELLIVNDVIVTGGVRSLFCWTDDSAVNDHFCLPMATDLSETTRPDRLLARLQRPNRTSHFK